MNDTAKPRRVPVGRTVRAARLGGAGLGIAGNMALGGARELLSGRAPTLRDLALTPGNIGRLTAELARMRGAAMKVGQLISMDAGDVLPPELSNIISRLRSDADFMPPKQLRDVLDAEWEPGWMKRFQRFNVRPIAAASIGQVHEATDLNGRHLAIKVQYPGIRESIDSDVSNVGTLVRMSGMVPKGIELAPLLDVAKRQLHEEADYLREAAELQRFGTWLSGDARFAVPDFCEALSTRNVLAMDFLRGTPIETLDDADQAARDGALHSLLDLTFRELFELGHMQSDPNFANYRLRKDGTILLLDFGAARRVDPDIRSAYGTLLRAIIDKDRAGMEAGLEAMGAFGPLMGPSHRATFLDLLELLLGGITSDGWYDFGQSDLRREMTERGMALADDPAYTHVPPVEALYVQRKLIGMFLLATRLRARVNLFALFGAYV